MTGRHVGRAVRGGAAGSVYWPCGAGRMGDARLFLVIVASLFHWESVRSPRCCGRSVPESVGSRLYWPVCYRWGVCLRPIILTVCGTDGADRQPLPVLVVGKVFAHWVIAGVPVVLLSPLLGLQFGLDARRCGCWSCRSCLGRRR